VARIAELNPTKEALLNNAQLTGLGQSGVDSRLTARPGHDQSVFIDHALEVADLVLDSASPFE
jgi:hypothetical protein